MTSIATSTTHAEHPKVRVVLFDARSTTDGERAAIGHEVSTVVAVTSVADFKLAVSEETDLLVVCTHGWRNKGYFGRKQKAGRTELAELKGSAKLVVLLICYQEESDARAWRGVFGANAVVHSTGEVWSTPMLTALKGLLASAQDPLDPENVTKALNNATEGVEKPWCFVRSYSSELS